MFSRISLIIYLLIVGISTFVPFAYATVLEGIFALITAIAMIANQ